MHRNDKYNGLEAHTQKTAGSKMALWFVNLHLQSHFERSFHRKSLLCNIFKITFFVVVVVAFFFICIEIAFSERNVLTFLLVQEKNA